MNRITDEQVRRNRDARQGWELYRSHREHVTRSLISSSPAPDATLCVLGAGNCNDLDLQQLRSHFGSIHLVDLDADALTQGCEQQGVVSVATIHRVGGIDLSDIARHLGGIQPETLPPKEILTELARHAQLTPLPELPRGPFDVVASVGLLTQLIEMVDVTLGTQHPQFLELMSSVRLRHLRLLLELTKPGGRAWLFTEVVSSATCPELLTTRESDLLSVLHRAIAQQNFFTGVNPAIIGRLFREDPQLATSVATVEMPPPWLWTFFTRTYAVWPFVVTKRG